MAAISATRTHTTATTTSTTTSTLTPPSSSQEDRPWGEHPSPQRTEVRNRLILHASQVASRKPWPLALPAVPFILSCCFCFYPLFLLFSPAPAPNSPEQRQKNGIPGVSTDKAAENTIPEYTDTFVCPCRCLCKTRNNRWWLMTPQTAAMPSHLIMHHPTTTLPI